MSATEIDADAKMMGLRPILSAYGVSQLGNWLFRAGVIYEVYNRSHGSAAVLTAAILLVYLPILVGSRFLAPMVDRWETRSVMIALDIARALLLSVLFVVVLASEKAAAPLALFTLGVLCLLSPMFGASQAAYLRRSLEASDMSQAFAAVAKVDWGTFVLGTVAGPLMLELTDVPQLVLVDIATFCVSALFLATLSPAPSLATPAREVSGGRRLKPGTRRLLISVAMLNAGAGLINVYPNVVTRDFLFAGAGILGLINMVDGLGGYLGATIAGKIKDDRRRRPIFLGAILVAVSLVMMSAAGFLPVVLFASALLLLAGQVFAVSAQARVLQNEPAELAGRISGYFTLATFGGVTLSTIAFPLATWFGPVRTTFPWLLVAGGGLAAAVAFRVRNDAVRDGNRDGNSAEGESEAWADSNGRSVTTPNSALTAGSDSIARQLRAVGGQFATGVTVVTAHGLLDPHGMTANSFATVSVDPPMVLVCVRGDARMAAVLQTGVLVGFSVLSSDHQDVAKYFANSSRGTGNDQFSAHAWSAGPLTGLPLLDDSLAWFECEVAEIVPAGDHNVILAKVLGLEVDPSVDDPLVFFRGRFHEGVASPGPSTELKEPV